MGLNVNVVKHYEWAYLVSATIEIVRENKRAGDADSDDWTRCSAMRQKLWQRTRDKWALLTDKPQHQFPWSEDAVCDWYMKCRKRRDDELDDYETDVKEIRKHRGLGRVSGDGQLPLG